MKYLNPAELRKYAWRPTVFIRKLRDREPFLVRGGRRVVLKPPRGAYKILENGRREELLALRFVAVPPPDEYGINDVVLDESFEAPYKLSDILKTAEFGGGKRSTKDVEDKVRIDLVKQIEHIKTQIGSSTVPIRLGTKVYQVAQVVATPKSKGSDVKSDFQFIDIHGLSIAWISHKKGNKPYHFNQYGGISELLSGRIFRTAEVQGFIKACVTQFGDHIPQGRTAIRFIKRKQLRMMGIYGIDFGGPLGPQNVTAVIQGEIHLVNSGKSYKLQAFSVHMNGEELTDNWEPVLQCTFKGDRSQYGIRGARFSIAPLKGRPVTDIL